MKLTKKIIASAVAASVLAAGVVAPVQAEVGASVGIASTYLWRGVDLGTGTPAVSGDLNYSSGGAYAGIWGSSGDTGTGSEYDLYLGYGTTFGADDKFSADLSLWNYNYPGGDIDAGELSEVVLSLGYGPVSFSIYDNVAGGAGYMYYSLSSEVCDGISVTLGMHDNAAEGADDMAHLDVSYAYNDNLSFTFSQQVADEAVNDDMKFVVSYSIPLGK